MRPSTLLSAAFAATAIAGPLQAEKRAYKTEITWVTVTVTVYADHLPEPTPASYEKPNPYPVAPKPKPTEPKEYPKPPPSSKVYVAPKPAYTPPPKPAYTPPAKPAAPPPLPPKTNDYKGNCLRHHNIHRANHSAPALVWDDSLASAAYMLAKTCVFKHNTKLGVGGYGQNLAASMPGNNYTAQISDGWYNKEAHNYKSYYGMANPPKDIRPNDGKIFAGYGHFSQMVWKGTKRLGCASVDCMHSMGMWYTVCNYSPPGNYGGQYAANVGKPLGHPTCNWND